MMERRIRPLGRDNIVFRVKNLTKIVYDFEMKMELIESNKAYELVKDYLFKLIRGTLIFNLR